MSRAAARMTPETFEALYRRNPDPWGYECSPYERDKYAASLAACGPGPFADALELGGSIGVFTLQLAPRCRRLTSVDAAATAVAAARQRLAGEPQVEAVLGELPGAIPDRRFDLVVASEILYYLEPAALTATLERLCARTVRGARLVAVHWRPTGDERPLTAAEVHAQLAARPELGVLSSAPTVDYLLDVLERR
jgi:hypothetical protein